MAELKAGKFTLSPQSGAAGTHSIVHKLNATHTGRNPYTRVIKASIKEDPNVSTIETLTIAGAPYHITFPETSKQAAYNATTVVFTCTTNAYGIYIYPAEDEPDNLIAGIDSTEVYNVKQEGTSYRLTMADSSTGSQAEATFPIKIRLTQNSTTETRGYSLRIDMIYEDGSVIETDNLVLTIIQDSSDSAFNAYFNPADHPTVSKAGETFTVDIFSNTSSYTVDEDVSWIDAFSTKPSGSGSSYTAQLTITVSSQKVAALAREGTIYLKSSITGSILASMLIKQEAGEAYNIKWGQTSLSFEPTDFSKAITKTNTLTANSNWDLTESV